MLAAFSSNGELLRQFRLATNPDYDRFLKELGQALRANFADFKFASVCCAIPGRVDRQRGVGEEFGNLKWRNVPIKKDINSFLATSVLVENDANLAGLSEALLVHDKYKKVLYLTISTGIGDGVIINGKIDPDLADSEAGHMVLPFKGKLQKWEDFASGRALHKEYGKLASEIDDPAIWKLFVKNIALGLYELLAIVQPEVVIVGGGVGAHFEKFGAFLSEELSKNSNNMVEIPPIIKAKRPEEAVIYGCYEFIRQNI